MTATLLPNAKQQFLDVNGVPLAGGFVYFYIPNTSTLKDTWQDAGQVIPNANPVVLDSSGEAIIYGLGQYRQIVKDALGNLIWDQLTNDTSGLILATSANVADRSTSTVPTSNLMGLVLLDKQTASNSPSLNFTSHISTVFNSYRLEFINIIPITAGTDLLLRIGDLNGYKSGGSDYATIGTISTSNGITSLVSSGAASVIQISTDISASGGTSVCGHIDFTLNQNGVVPFRFELSYINNTSNLADYRGSGAYIGGGIQQDRLTIFHGSGNIASGTICLYGLRPA